MLSATINNEHTNPKALKALKLEVEQMLKANKWKVRNYFSNKGCLRNSESSSAGGTEQSSSGGTEQSSEPETTGRNTNQHPAEDIVTEDDETVNVDNTERSQDDDIYSEHAHSDSTDRDLEGFQNDKITVIGSPGRLECSFDHLVFRDAGEEELVTRVYNILFPLLKLCMLDHASGNPSTEMGVLSHELRAYIDRISMTFRRHNAYHTFRRTAHVVAWSNHLFERLQDSDAGHSGMLDPGPWYRLALTMAALIRDCKHSGVTDTQLRKEDSFVVQMHGMKNSQAKYSLSFGLDLLEEEFPDLFRELRWGCPSFLFTIRKAALVRDPTPDFLACMKLPIESQQDMAQRTEATLALVMKLADYGHFTLKYGNFKDWTEALFAERRLASLAGRGKNPVATWHDDCIHECQYEVLPLFQLCESTFPGLCRFEESVLSNLKALTEESEEMARQGLFPRRFNMRDSTEHGHGILVRRATQ